MAAHQIWLIFFFICGVIALIHKCTSSSSVDDPEIIHSIFINRDPIPPASILSRHKVKATSTTSCSNGKWTSSSSTATCPPAAVPSSSSVEPPEIKYDVFISFRGPDVRFSFLSHLLDALSAKKIDYFVDDQEVKQGDDISSTLLNAIKNSQILLVLFSEDYASSKWCLQELEQIIQCMENQKQIILPVFYKVDPSTVRHQKGSYNEAFGKHGERYDKDRLQKWKAALKRATDLCGFDFSQYNTEATLIKEIVECVLAELRKTGNQIDLKGFVGIQKHIQYLETLLHTVSQDILAIGIWGMGGIGKTAIAEILYNRLHNKYEGSHLLCVREDLEKGKSIRDLKKDLFSKLLDEDVHIITLNGIPEYVDRRLRKKKVLVVLDDINDSNHLKILIEGMGFGLGSKIIMTSRDKQVFWKECDEIYHVERLNSKDALRLFEKCLETKREKEKCLQKSSINKQELCELSKKVVDYAKGVPLAIIVLGHDLAMAKSKLEWENKLEKLNKIPDLKIQQVLELSYNGLDDEYKDIFLYLACFFRNELYTRIINSLDACGYHTIDGLRVLRDKALITFDDGFVSMHDLIQVMGREIVRRRSPKDIGQRSHLWNVNDVCEVFNDQLGSQTIEAIGLNMWKLEKGLQLGPKAFVGMNNLRILQFDMYWPAKNKSCKVYPPEEGFESLPRDLRYFYWEMYPMKSFPLRCCVNNLVELYFESSQLERLWDGVQELPSLTVINVSYSSNLIELADLSKAPTLNYVSLRCCYSLCHVPLWLGHNIDELESAKCEEYLDRNSLPTSLNTDIGESDEVDYLHVNSPLTLALQYALPSLQRLNLNHCRSIFALPDNFGLYLPSLHTLSMRENRLKTLPTSIRHLAKLASLFVGNSKLLRYIPELPASIKYFDANDCISLETLQFSSNSKHLSHQKDGICIELGDCMELGEHTLEAVAMHYKLLTKRIISANRENSNALLYFPGSKVPKCFKSCGARHDSVSISLELPLHSEATGFIFYFLIRDKSFPFELKIKWHIESSYVAKVQFIYSSINLPKENLTANYVLLWYGGSLSFKIMKELSRIKTLTTDDLCAKVWFELLDNEFKYPREVKEWGVYPIFISSEP